MALAIDPGLRIIQPEWDVIPCVKSAATCRLGGVSVAGYQGLNLAAHVGDDPRSVRRNRRQLAAELELPEEPRWLEQVHSPVIVCADEIGMDAAAVAADGIWTDRPGTVCAVLTADCLPVLLCDADGTRVAAVHAGWRGLAAGILANSLDVFLGAGIAAEQIKVWFGPAIGAAAYEVDAVVRDAFLQLEPACAGSFTPGRPGHWQFSLYVAARVILSAYGVTDISGGDLCTFSDERFYSYRRNNDCGRQASLIWLSNRK